jgi:hypothetical protein
MRTSRLLLAPLLAAALVSAACSGGANPLEPQGGSNVSAPPEISPSLLGGLLGKQYLACSPLAAQSKSASVGLLGGVIKIGPHKLVIPPGAVLSRKTITAQITAGDASNSIQFSPEGLKFKVPPVLVISYANCTVSGGILGMVKLAYTSNDLSSILELLPAVANPLNKTVVGTITHFSRYAVAY